MAAPQQAAGALVRQAVLWATPRAAPELPVEPDLPAALLPVGDGSAAEYAVEALAHLGVRQIDLVVCDRPEGLRERLGNGERWGVEIHWHLARDPQLPYGVLRHLDLPAGGHVVLGHLDRWVAMPALEQLVAHRGPALMLDGADAPVWSGWACLPADTALAELAGSDEAALQRAVLGQALPPLLLAAGQVVTLDAAGLLTVQQHMGRDGLAPLHWRITPWGAMSPHAHVHPGARIEGPVWIGSGCVVSEGAQVGPDVLLAEDVVVAGGASVSHSVVMARSYVGAGLELRRTLVDGPRIHHLDLGVTTAMPSSEGLLLSLHDAPRRRPSLPGRLIALLLALTLISLLPLALALTFFDRRVRGLKNRPWLLWQRRPMVVAYQEGSTQPLTGPLRCSLGHYGGLRGLVAQAGGILDIAQGRRCWFGVRARRSSELYALSAEWQLLLRDAPIGLLNAPAFDEDDSAWSEARAAADVHYAAQTGLARNWGIAKALLQAWLRPAPAGTLAGRASTGQAS
ncbi:MAG: hypothetical protein RIQ60_2008 [Pseudomonadota bacterium]|jgi:hypothetical protein